MVPTVFLLPIQIFLPRSTVPGEHHAASLAGVILRVYRYLSVKFKPNGGLCSSVTTGGISQSGPKCISSAIAALEASAAAGNRASLHAVLEPATPSNCPIPAPRAADQRL